MLEKLTQLLQLRPGEWKLATLMLLLLAINAMVYDLVQVVATAGFLSNVGPKQLPWVWILDMVMLLVFGSLYALVVDRAKRVYLVGWLLGGFALIYLIIFMMFSYGVPEGFNYFLLFIFADQQSFIFPLAFWALANDVYRIAEAKRLFPVIGAGLAIGSVIGNTVAVSSASWFARYGGQTYQLLVLASVVLLVGVAVLFAGFHDRPTRARQSKGSEFKIRDTVEMGMDFYKNVPLFHYLAIVVFLVYMGYTIIQYNFLAVMSVAFTTAAEVQAFFGTYRIVLIVATLLFQGFVTSRLLARIEVKSSFILFPAVVALSGLSGLAFGGLTGGVMAVFVMVLVERAWDQPARKLLQGFIPDERRGRVSTFLDTYVLAVATILACVVLLLLFLVASLMQLSDQTVAMMYLSITVLTGAGGTWAAIRAKAEYDQSMLNWRLTRRQRRGLTGVMNKLDL
ncbi:MAG: hypothetical protein Kow0031_30850 [Anaerolineae bacterium]